MKMKNNAGDEFEVIREYIAKVGNRTFTMWDVRFLNTNTIKTVYKSNAEKGKVRDPYKPSFCGIGYDGEFEKVVYWRQAKRLWSNMIKRCYDPNYRQGYFGRGYSVDSRWLCFSNFLKDLPELENFKEWLLGFEEGKPKYNLDKDLKLEGNKIYCKQFCSFVPEGINKAAGARNGKPYTKKPRVSVSKD